MIPWIKEKFIERRARWLARQHNGNKKSDETCSTQKCDLDPLETSADGPIPNQLRIRNPNEITIRVVSPLGTVANLSFPSTASGLEVKMKVLGEFAKDLVDDPSSNEIVNLNLEHFKLIKPRVQFVFDENQTLREAQIQDNDELLLLNHCRPPEVNNRDRLKGPQQCDIDRITNYNTDNIRKVSQPIVNVNDLVLQSDIQHDIRQIVISLAQSSAYIIGIGPYAKRLIEMFKQKLIGRRRHEIDALQNLLEMGFERSAVIQALRITNDVYSVALDWLIENPNSSNISITESSSFTTSGITSSNSVRENVESLLEIIRIYCQRYIHPSNEMIQRLKEMGFNENEIREALKITRNNYNDACEWLLGNRPKTNTNYSYGLSPDSPILRVLLASPHVQLSLSNPKTFIAYLSILENYTSMNMWMGDCETAGIIGHILRTYHEEKHILAINQFSTRF